MLSIHEARKALGRIVDAAFFLNEITIISKNGIPRAAIVPIDMLTKLEEQKEIESCLEGQGQGQGQGPVDLHIRTPQALPS